MPRERNHGGISNIPEEASAATVGAAWQQGVRYFDTAPLCGAGLLLSVGLRRRCSGQQLQQCLGP